MRVLHVTPYFHPALVYGGPIYSTYRLAAGAAQRGAEVRVLTTSANGLDADLPLAEGRHVMLAPRLLSTYCPRLGRHHFSPTLLASLPAAIRWADVVHLTAVYSFPTIPTLLLCRLLRRPVVWSPRGALQRWAGSTRIRLKASWEAACRLAAPAALRLHVTSAAEEAESASRFPGVVTVMIPNGVDLPARAVSSEGDGRLRLVFLGRLHPKKGLEELFDACRLLEDRGSPSWTLTIAGSGSEEYEQRLRTRVERGGLANRVRFVGQVGGGGEKQDFFARADLLVMPSHTENFGLVAAEALAHGVPVIASHGTPWARLESERCGMWVGNDPASLAAAIGRLAQMPLQEMGIRGRAWMEREFGWDAVATAMEGAYSTLLAV